MRRVQLLWKTGLPTSVEQIHVKIGDRVKNHQPLFLYNIVEICGEVCSPICGTVKDVQLKVWEEYGPESHQFDRINIHNAFIIETACLCPTASDAIVIE